MENGKMAALLAIVCGFIIGYKWPRIKKEINPYLKKGVKQAKKYTEKGIKSTVKMFTGRNSVKKPARA
ncbi:MAG: hypothetical protein P9M13_07490 [Candidatus Ancaeobacter aquaticus]|nr:hypothetical protein [Candidatus Ancaeobacter aquaticus]